MTEATKIDGGPEGLTMMQRFSHFNKMLVFIMMFVHCPILVLWIGAR